MLLKPTNKQQCCGTVTLFAFNDYSKPRSWHKPAE